MAHKNQNRQIRLREIRRHGSHSVEASAYVTAAMEAATCATAGSERYRWRNQAKCCYCEQGNNNFT
jgi:hypothetical protein